MSLQGPDPTNKEKAEAISLRVGEDGPVLYKLYNSRDSTLFSLYQFAIQGPLD